jgi:predicted alpha/beta-hydrolase family hydrolase
MRITVATPSGAAWVDLDRPRLDRAKGAARCLLVLGHGAGGGVDAPDLAALRAGALEAGFAVAAVTQPYRVLGRRAPAPAPRLDEAWLAVIDALARRPTMRGLPLMVAGRSSGARVACRTATQAGAVGVLVLAFPVHPPGRPERSRLDELALPTVPVLVVQGDRDAFGMPPAAENRTVVVVAGADHSLKKDPAAVAEAGVAFALSLL